MSCTFIAKFWGICSFERHNGNVISQLQHEPAYVRLRRNVSGLVISSVFIRPKNCITRSSCLVSSWPFSRKIYVLPLDPIGKFNSFNDQVISHSMELHSCHSWSWKCCGFTDGQEVHVTKLLCEREGENQGISIWSLPSMVHFRGCCFEVITMRQFLTPARRTSGRCGL